MASTEVLGIVRLKIKPGKLEQFKKIQAHCLELVKTKDKGTLQYDCFLNEQGTESLVIERYVDSQALIDHFTNMGDMTPIFECATAYGEVCGNITDELKKRLVGSPVQHFLPYLNFKGAQ